jgi:hypothetical protein
LLNLDRVEHDSGDGAAARELIEHSMAILEEIGDQVSIVSGLGMLYGDNNNWFAAFAYWLFKLYGHRDVCLMNGGSASMRAAH